MRAGYVHVSISECELFLCFISIAENIFPGTRKITVKRSQLILFLTVPLFSFAASTSGSKEACSGKKN